MANVVIHKHSHFPCPVVQLFSRLAPAFQMSGPGVKLDVCGGVSVTLWNSLLAGPWLAHMFWTGELISA